MLVSVLNIKVSCEWHKAIKLNYKNSRIHVMYSAWNPKDNYDMSASVFVVQFNGFMSLTTYFDVKYGY